MGGRKVREEGGRRKTELGKDETERTRVARKKRRQVGSEKAGMRTTQPEEEAEQESVYCEARRTTARNARRSGSVPELVRPPALYTCRSRPAPCPSLRRASHPPARSPSAIAQLVLPLWPHALADKASVPPRYTPRCSQVVIAP